MAGRRDRQLLCLTGDGGDGGDGGVGGVGGVGGMMYCMAILVAT